VVANQGDRFVLFDSKQSPVLQVMSWPELKNRWRYVEKENGVTRDLFDLLPVRPRFRGTAKAEFSVDRAFFLRRPENSDLARHWDEYLSDLLEICRPRGGRGGSALSMAEFLRRNQDLLVGRVDHWHGGVGREQLERQLRNFRFVAETYGLVIPEMAAKRALVDLSVLLAMWSAAGQGLNAIYGADPIPTRRRSVRAYRRTALRRAAR
jgi:hypothetical protein